MKFTLTTSVVLLGLASALPAHLDAREEPSNAPIDWDGPNSSGTFQCGKNTYDGHYIYLAAQQAVNLGILDPPQTRGAGKYPHPFDNDDSKGVKLKFPAHYPEHGRAPKGVPAREERAVQRRQEQ
ncbi:hypothetical protein HIM_11051 [Hirsutella minnesotensis 3608]|uniref:Uncharacterized protein n=1 Tax=Hirsutella minnesotensis 3608 TaxID=1043627 RepID=A0A0F7ZRG2_9HYPO|nr:hypothetical protein HIM_11051 [Hirsutella minnesotensis 3608]